jgi:hypothetical protein
MNETIHDAILNLPIFFLWIVGLIAIVRTLGGYDRVR